MTYTFTLDRYAQTPPDFTCRNPECDEAAPAEQALHHGMRCDNCGDTMLPAPWARAVPRQPTPA